MALKNIANRQDIDSGTLRQRRDFYAFGIGLLLFNLAGGYLSPDAAQVTLLPIKFSNPEILYWVAWGGFVYFLWRFWLMAPPAWRQFAQEIGLQAGNRSFFKSLVAEQIKSADNPEAAEDWLLILNRKEGYFSPGLILHGGKFQLYAAEIHDAGNSHSTGMARTLEFPHGHRWQCRWTALKAIAFAIVYERSFSDYVAPYLLAILCIAVQLGWIF